MKEQTIVSTDWLAQHLADPNVIIFDCRFRLADPTSGQVAYSTSHIPGAHYVHLDKDLSGIKTGSNGRHPLPTEADFKKVLSRLGVESSKLIVAYDDAGGMFAARLWWLMRWVGLFNCGVLDGGWEKWIAEQHEVNNAPPPPGDSSVKVQANNSLTVTVGDIMHQLEATPSMQLIDARSAERFRGENETIDLIGGHIPGALNRFYQANLDADGCFKSASVLREEFTALLHESGTKTIVHQCGSGVTACHNLLAMEIAGLHGSKLYPGSWSEWCADSQRPIAR